MKVPPLHRMPTHLPRSSNPFCTQRRPLASPNPDQNGQIMGIKRQDVTQQMRFSGMPTRRKSVKR